MINGRGTVRVVQVNSQGDVQQRPPKVLLDTWQTLSNIAGAVAGAGAAVTVVQASHIQQQLERAGVTYEFVPAIENGPARIAEAVARLQPDVIHVSGLCFPHHINALHAALPDTPLLVRDHASAVPNLWHRQTWKQALRHAAGFAFTAPAQAVPFVRSGVISAGAPIFAVPESSSHFTPGDAAHARSVLGVAGDPCIAWVGRLNANKDPITVLHGFAQATAALPQAQLWMCYGDAPLLPRVRAMIRQDPALRGRVHLLGALPHERVELLLRTADFYVACSYNESTGFALIEALACGATPIVTDIPAFRAVLADGAYGELIPVGDAFALGRALVERASSRSSQQRLANRGYFEAELSFAALGRRLVSVYDQLRGTTKRAPPTQHNGRAPTAPRRLRVALVLPGGVDRSGVQRVIPCLLGLIERTAREVELHVVALQQEPYACTYPLLGAAVHCLAAGGSRPSVLRSLLKLHRTFDFDVWHAVWAHPQGSLTGAAGALTRRPVLLHINGGDLVGLRDIDYGGLARARGRVWLRAAVATASHITVPSLAMQRSARRFGIEPEVVTYGVATDHWPVRQPEPRVLDEAARLLHVGNLNRVKDQATLLRALATLHARRARFTIDMIGVDTLDGQVQRLCTELGLDDVVRFHGELPQSGTRQFFEQAHLLVMSSKHEADPIVALEAAIAGIPTVGTAVGHLIDWTPDAAITVPVGDADGLAAATLALLEDDKRRVELARRAQTRALQMDADKGAARVLELYRSLAATNSRFVRTPT
jgi:glycosyltransferase involved in cell wall biosynthesis